MCVPSRLRLVLAVVCLILPGISASCGPLPAETVSGANYTSICSLVLGYANNVALSPTATCAALDDNPMSLVASFASALSSPCAYAVVKYTCAILHPPCNQPPPVYLPPSELCTALNVSDPSTVCTGFDPYILPMLQQAMQSNGVTSFSYSLCSPPQFNSTVTFKPPANQTLGYATKQELTLPSCASFTSTTSPCTGVVDYPVYLSASSPYQIPQSEGLVAGFSFLNNLVPASCANNYQKLMCYSTFPRCQNLLELYSAVNPQVAGLVAAGLVVPIASSPTRALCNNVMATCGSDPTGTPWVAPWFYPLGLTAFCDSQRISARGCDGPLPSVLSTTPAFLPPNGTSPAAGVTILPIDIYNNASVSAYISCPSPLVRPDSPNAKTLNGGSCAIPCPTWFFFPDDFWTDKIDPLLLTIGTISIFLHLVSLTLFILNSNRTLLPLINVLMILVAFALWAPAAFRKNHRNDFGKFAGAICDDNSQSSDTYGCLGAAVVLFWSGLAASTMWLIVCVEVMFSAWYPLDVVKQKFQRIKRILVFIAFFWPTVSTIANAAEGQLGSDGGGNPVCFIKDDDLAYYRYFVPTLTISCVGAVFIIIAFFGVHRSATKTSDTHRFMSFYARSVLFVLVFILIQVIWIAYATSERNKTDQYTAQTTEYVTCLLSGRPASILQHAQNPAVPIIDCETYRPQRSPGFFLFVEALLLGYGLWFFPVFVRNGDFGRAWNNLMGIMHPKSETREVPRTASRNSAQSARSARGSSASNLGTWRVDV